MVIRKLGYICYSWLTSVITLQLELIQCDLKSGRGRKYHEYLRKKLEVI